MCIFNINSLSVTNQLSHGITNVWIRICNICYSTESLTFTVAAERISNYYEPIIILFVFAHKIYLHTPLKFISSPGNLHPPQLNINKCSASRSIIELHQ